MQEDYTKKGFFNGIDLGTFKTIARRFSYDFFKIEDDCYAVIIEYCGNIFEQKYKVINNTMQLFDDDQ